MQALVRRLGQAAAEAAQRSGAAFQACVDAAVAAAEEAGASVQSVALVAGEAAGATVVAQGGTKEEAVQAAAQVARAPHPCPSTTCRGDGIPLYIPR